MKKMLAIIFISLLVFSSALKAQVCDAVTAEVTAPSPQTGSYNYFGVRVTLSQLYSEDVTVTGYIYVDGSPNLDNPYTLIITAGNISAESNTYFFQTSPADGAAVEISTVTPCPVYSILNMSSSLLDYIGQKQNELNDEGGTICSQVNSITSDVSVSGSGVLIFPDWVRFVLVGEAIDSLNSIWDQLYAAKMNAIINYAFSIGAVNGSDNEENRELVWDIIEENYFIIEENKATSCLETKFGFNSLQTQLTNSEDAWLEAGNSNMSQNPAFNEDIPEEYWSLMSTNRTVNITDVNVANQLLNSAEDDATKKDLLSKIKEIVEIIGSLIDGLSDLANLMKDCDGSTEAHVRHIRDGYLFDNDNRKIGYEMEQRSVTFDIAHTDTKIKGKAKLFKKKSNGNYKKDRKNTVGINFCAKEWNNCDSLEWPSDNGFYQHPLNIARKKVKTIHFSQPYALAIDKSWHYVEFHFYALGNYVVSFNLLGSSSCQ